MVEGAPVTELGRLIDFLKRQPAPGSISLAEKRANQDRAQTAFKLPDGVSVLPWTRGGLSGELLQIDGAVPRRAMLYLHGGGYHSCSPRSHRHLAAAIGVAARATVLVPEYRLAPEHPFPAAFDDALAAYDWLAASRPDASLCIAGDSAGGGLALSVMVARRDSGRPADAGVLISPWADLACSPQSRVAEASADDPMIDHDELTWAAGCYLGGAPADDPRASPVHADLRGLPPILIHASRAEALRFDAERLAAAARDAGVDVTLDMVEQVPHVWHWFWPRLEIARRSIEEIGAWLETRWREA